MKKLIPVQSGQPVRIDDFVLVQDNAQLIAYQLIKGLAGSSDPCIVNGLRIDSTSGSEPDDPNKTLSEGYFYDGQEICFVASLDYIEEAGFALYLVPVETTSDNRRFADDSYHDVHKTKEYEARYVDTQPANSFVYDNILRIENLLTVAIDPNVFKLSPESVASLKTGFSHAAGYPGTGMHVLTDGFSNFMLLCYFNATTNAGLIATIEMPKSIPAAIYGQFINNESNAGYFRLTPSGDIYVERASTTEVNIIQFQFNLNFLTP